MKFNIKNVKISNFDKKINLRLPEYSNNELAEFMGIMTGDGYMNKYGKHFSLLEITGDSSLDKEYLTNHVSNLIANLFNLKPKVIYRKNQNTMVLRLMSKGLNNFLLEIGFKNGKKGQIEIPRWILKDYQYMKHFIGGLADTDGSLVLLNRKQKKYVYYPRVQVTSISENLINNIGNWLIENELPLCIFIDKRTLTYKGITKTHEGYRFQISGRKNLDRWMDLVGFRNQRHLNKYEKYKKNGAAGI
jgi:hypothetical protein